MTEPQVWTLIGVFGTALFGTLTLTSTIFVRILRAEIGSVRTEIGAVRTEISAVDAKLTAEIRRVEGVLATRIDHLDRDVSAINRREFPDPPAA